MSVQDVTYEAFEQRLRRALFAARGTLVIGLRIDGEVTSDNILIRTSNLYEQHWRVLASTHQHSRAETWNIVTMIATVLTRDTPLREVPSAEEIQQACHRGISRRRRGWLLLRVEEWKITNISSEGKP